MFTGIIESKGRIRSVEDRRIVIEAPFSEELRIDESVSVNGTCLTVVEQDAETFSMDVVEETLAKTNLGRLKPGASVNLERAMRIGDRLDGHIVQGHVDTVGEIVRIEELDGSHLVFIRFAEEFEPYLIPMGSVTLDGISLTVARLEGSEFGVAIIPHTWAVTTASEWSGGGTVNIEFDVLGKYAVRAMEVFRR